LANEEGAAEQLPLFSADHDMYKPAHGFKHVIEDSINCFQATVTQ
jgi:hypothetical protein